MASGERGFRLWPRLLLILVAVPPALFLLSALIGSLWVRNADWSPASPADDAVLIAVEHNGIHSGIAVPLDGMEEGLRRKLGPVPDGSSHVLLGWGAERFYRNTPSWSEVHPGDVAEAMAGTRDVVVHATFRRSLEPRERRHLLKVSRRTLQILERDIAAQIEPAAEAEPGYGARDRFIAARGRYSALYGCNQWAADRLAHAGLPAPLWSPLPQPVLAAVR